VDTNQLPVGSRRSPALLTAVAAIALTLSLGSGKASGQPASAIPGAQNSGNRQKVPHFDVVSIKPTPPSDDKVLIQQFPDGTSFHGASVRMVLRTAFGVEDDRILGAPGWASTSRYDIEAKVAPEEAPELEKLKAGERDAMLIPLLVERFNLSYHHETRERSTYVLVVAKGGPRLGKGEPFPSGGPKPAEQNLSEGQPKEHYKVYAIPGYIEADSMPMWVLADRLTLLLGRTVVDKTGLSENYDFTLHWTPDNPPPSVLAVAANSSAQAENASEAAPPPLFTAIQEQLGLKLESKKNSVDVIVIDHINRPSPN
jgi:uncharacterized protein (TIGR03435 family)